jgi:DNA-binding response OmpR family regulator
MEPVKQLLNFFRPKKTHKKNILLVDDNKICLKANSYVVESYNSDLNIVTADTGQKALDIIRNHEFEFIILDLGMSDINGIEILKMMNLKKDDVKKVIVLTVYDSDYFKIACKHLNAHSFIEKPLNLEKLLSVFS